MSGLVVRRVWFRGAARSAVSAVVCLAVTGGLLLAAGSGPAAEANAAPKVPAGLLPSPGLLLPAPKSLAAAESEISAVLAQAENPKTALAGVVRLLVNSGVTIVNGRTTVYGGRRGGPPLVMQAGQVQALANDMAGPVVELNTLLKGFAGADSRQMRRRFTAAFYGRNFAAEITGASDAAEYLWGAVLLDADTSADGLVASLHGGGTPADALAPLQLQFLSMRLESDALSLAASYYPRSHSRDAKAAAQPQAVHVNCDISYVPDSFFEGLSGAYSTGISLTLKAAGMVAKAEKYDATMAIASMALTVLNIALMMATLHVDTKIDPDPIVRTQDTTPGGRSKLTSTFTFSTSKLDWADCVRVILDLVPGVDISKPGAVVKNMHIKWSVAGGDPATIDPDTYETSDHGVATSWLEGTPQAHELTNPVPYIRPITITESVNPLLSRSLTDLFAHYAVIGLLAAVGGPTGKAVAAVQLVADAAQGLGLIRTDSTVEMKDWKDGSMTLNFTATTSFTDSCSGSDPFASNCAITDYPWAIGEFAGVTTGSFSYQAQGQGTLTAAVPLSNGSGSGALTESGISVSATGSATGTAGCTVDGTFQTVPFNFSQSMTSDGTSIPGAMTVSLTPIENAQDQVTDFDMGVNLNQLEAGPPDYYNGDGPDELYTIGETYSNWPGITSDDQCGSGSDTEDNAHWNQAVLDVIDAYQYNNNNESSGYNLEYSGWTINPEWTAETGGIEATKTVTVTVPFSQGTSADQGTETVNETWQVVTAAQN